MRLGFRSHHAIPAHCERRCTALVATLRAPTRSRSSIGLAARDLDGLIAGRAVWGDDGVRLPLDYLLARARPARAGGASRGAAR